ncbi:MAG: hypothetical protein CM15mP77_3700 [Synechococcus sp.]|nr:MAG: hypothetical protein CM15mP77_3700 [Synechococcus sp.]
MEQRPEGQQRQAGGSSVSRRRLIANRWPPSVRALVRSVPKTFSGHFGLLEGTPRLQNRVLPDSLEWIFVVCGGVATLGLIRTEELQQTLRRFGVRLARVTPPPVMFTCTGSGQRTVTLPARVWSPSLVSSLHPAEVITVGQATAHALGDGAIIGVSLLKTGSPKGC